MGGAAGHNDFGIADFDGANGKMDGRGTQALSKVQQGVSGGSPASKLCLPTIGVNTS